MGKTTTGTLSSFRKLGRSINCIQETQSGSGKQTVSGKNSLEILNFSRMDTESADEVAEKILELDDFDNAFFLAPLNCSKLIEDDDEDGDEYWSKYKPILIERLSKRFSLRYGLDFAILRRGVFSLLVILTKDDDGDWFIPEEIRKSLMPYCPDVFMEAVDMHYRHTDSMFFPMNVITKNNDDKWKTTVKTIQVDITFLRSDSFKAAESEEKRTHFTYNIFKEGILHSVILEHGIVSFDDEDIDEYLSLNSEKECFSK